MTGCGGRREGGTGRSVPIRKGRRPAPGRRRNRPAGDEAGQVTVLALGYTVLSLLIVTVVLAVSSVYLEHKRLLSLADAAAVAAAASFTLAQESAGTGPGVALRTDRVRAAALEHLERSPESARLSGLALGAGTGSVDGRTAVVELTAVAHPPIVNFLVPDGIEIRAVSDARARLTR